LSEELITVEGVTELNKQVEIIRRTIFANAMLLASSEGRTLCDDIHIRKALASVRLKFVERSKASWILLVSTVIMLGLALNQLTNIWSLPVGQQFSQVLLPVSVIVWVAVTASVLKDFL
jgi:hypothetical protein